MTTRDDQPVMGMCKNCGKPVRAGLRGFNKDEHGRISHKFNCTNSSTPHKWEPDADTYGGPCLKCTVCGYVWKPDRPKPRTSCKARTN